ncbi:MAG: hypothetical protein JXQ83_10330 [Candidatus Glassbacteria bacterium]|nr:hypothetical protein [Candidatus Glassbacteria bacterium]
MDQETLTEILASMLATSDKWRGEVERNVLLQNTLEELFSEEVFQGLLARMLLPKFEDTYIPHFRAVELICTIRDLIRQMCHKQLERSSFDLELEDLELELNDEFGLSTEIGCSLDSGQALAEIERLGSLYKENPQFAARLDKFRLLVLPVSVSQDGDTRYQILMIKNVRSPRSRWKGK